MTATLLLEAYDHMIAALGLEGEALAAAAAFREALSIAANELDDYRDAFPLLRGELAERYSECDGISRCRCGDDSTTSQSPGSNAVRAARPAVVDAGADASCSRGRGYEQLDMVDLARRLTFGPVRP